LTLSYR